jgi:hypothetical protein
MWCVRGLRWASKGEKEMMFKEVLKRYAYMLTMLAVLCLSSISASSLPDDGAEAYISAQGVYLTVVNAPGTTEHGLVMTGAKPDEPNFIIGYTDSGRMTIQSKELGTYLYGANMQLALANGLLTNSSDQSRLRCIHSEIYPGHSFKATADQSGKGWTLRGDGRWSEFLRLDGKSLRLYQQDKSGLFLGKEFGLDPRDFNDMLESAPSQYYYTQVVPLSSATIFYFEVPRVISIADVGQGANQQGAMSGLANGAKVVLVTADGDYVVANDQKTGLLTRLTSLFDVTSHATVTLDGSSIGFTFGSYALVAGNGMVTLKQGAAPTMFTMADAGNGKFFLAASAREQLVIGASGAQISTEGTALDFNFELSEHHAGMNSIGAPAVDKFSDHIGAYRDAFVQARENPQDMLWLLKSFKGYIEKAIQIPDWNEVSGGAISPAQYCKKLLEQMVAFKDTFYLGVTEEAEILATEIIALSGDTSAAITSKIKRVSQYEDGDLDALLTYLESIVNEVATQGTLGQRAELTRKLDGYFTRNEVRTNLRSKNRLARIDDVIANFPITDEESYSEKYSSVINRISQIDSIASPIRKAGIIRNLLDRDIPRLISTLSVISGDVRSSYESALTGEVISAIRVMAYGSDADKVNALESSLRQATQNASQQATPVIQPPVSATTPTNPAAPVTPLPAPTTPSSTPPSSGQSAAQPQSFGNFLNSL